MVRLTSAAAVVLDGGRAISWFLGNGLSPSGLPEEGYGKEGMDGRKVLQDAMETLVVTGGRELSPDPHF
jgi:hypothetical protein